MLKIILFCLIIILELLACGGDCSSCHTNLDYNKDTRHQPMKECKTCHTNEKMAQIDMGGCGQDCFACHRVEKLISQELSKTHQSIKQCIECHANLTPFNNNQLFKQKIQPKFNTLTDKLKELN